MTTSYYIFKGKTNWCKVRQPDEKYDNYQVPLYMDEKSWEDFKAAGLRLVPKEDKDGEFVVFKRKHAEFNNFKKTQQINGPPDVFIKNEDGNYVPFPDKLIGNGSEITVKVEVYETRNGIAHRLVSVGVDKLVVFEREGQSNVPVMPF